MKNKRLKWYGIMFALFILFLYIMGTYDLFMMLGHNENYYMSKGYGQIVHEYFTNYPIIGLVFWVVNLLGGLISPILYLLKNKISSKIALVSFASDLILILLGALFNNRFKVFSTFVICFDLFILLITLLFGLFVYFEDKKILKKD